MGDPSEMTCAEDKHDEVSCTEDGCDRAVAVRLHDPRGPNRDVCLPHARVLAREDGVVAEPLTDSNADWP